MTTLRSEPSDLTRFYALFPQPSLARDLFNVVEGYRIDLLVRQAYPGIRRDMELIRAASAERRPNLLSLGDAQVVVEVLLQRGLGLDPDLADLADGVRALAEHASGLLVARITTESGVADSARLASELYVLIDDGLARAGQRALEQDMPPPDQAPPVPEDQQAPQEQGESADGLDVDEYEPLELPPFMTPVLEEMVRQQQAPAQAPAIPPEGQEPQAGEGEGEGEGGDGP